MTTPTEKDDTATATRIVPTTPDAGGRTSETTDDTTGQALDPSPDAQAVDAERRADEAEARAQAAEDRALVAMKIEAAVAAGVPSCHAHRLEGSTAAELAADARLLIDQMAETWWPTPPPRLRRPPSSLPFETLTPIDDDTPAPLPARNTHDVSPPRRRGWRAPHDDGPR